jgi:hypothetical protein
MTMRAGAGTGMISAAETPSAPMSAPILMTLATAKSPTSTRRVCRL